MLRYSPNLRDGINVHEVRVEEQQLAANHVANSRSDDGHRIVDSCCK